MAKLQPRLVLITPLLMDSDLLAPKLERALETSDVASVILRLAPADDRTLVNRIKELVPVAHRRDVALMVTDPGSSDVVMVAARGGADGVHVTGLDGARAIVERGRGTMMVGIGGLGSRHEAMDAGELEPDYLLFGEAGPDGTIPSPELVLERAAWWAEIFETPCIALARSAAEIAPLAETGAEFIALDAPIWSEQPEAAMAEAARALSRFATSPA